MGGCSAGSRFLLVSVSLIVNGLNVCVAEFDLEYLIDVEKTNSVRGREKYVRKNSFLRGTFMMSFTSGRGGVLNAGT